MTGILRSALSSALSLLLLSVLAAEVAAQGAEPPADPEPLRPVDTSSPRATLRSFLRNADRVAELRRGGEIGGERGNEAARRAVATLDLSATPHGNSRTIRGERAALLHEVLGRLDLPPESEIPGVREVADGQITRWTIPGTTIAFERVAAGRGGCDREPVDKHHKRVCATSDNVGSVKCRGGVGIAGGFPIPWPGPAKLYGQRRAAPECRAAVSTSTSANWSENSKGTTTR